MTHHFSEPLYLFVLQSRRMQRMRPILQMYEKWIRSMIKIRCRITYFHMEHTKHKTQNNNPIRGNSLQSNQIQFSPMAPPRAKMYAKTGKHKTIDTSASEQPAASSSGASSDPTPDAAERERQFELELCWCIQTMEASIDSNKLNAKQGSYFFSINQFRIHNSRFLHPHSTRHGQNHQNPEKCQPTADQKAPSDASFLRRLPR